MVELREKKKRTIRKREGGKRNEGKVRKIKKIKRI